MREEVITTAVLHKLSDLADEEFLPAYVVAVLPMRSKPAVQILGKAASREA